MKKHLSTIILILVFLVGLSLLLYPTVSDYWNSFHQSRAIAGNPYFTTDTGSALRGIEIEADVMLKGTRVDGVYTADPEKDKPATKFNEISFDEVYTRGLRIMDLTATALCKENNLPVYVFNMDVNGNLAKVLKGEPVGTLVHN